MLWQQREACVRGGLSAKTSVIHVGSFQSYKPTAHQQPGHGLLLRLRPHRNVEPTLGCRGRNVPLAQKYGGGVRFNH